MVRVGTLTFWLFCWEFVKEKVSGIFNDFYNRGRFVKVMNATISGSHLKKRCQRFEGF